MPLASSRSGEGQIGGSRVMKDGSGNDAAYLKPKNNPAPIPVDGYDANGRYKVNPNAFTGGGWLADALDGTVGGAMHSMEGVVVPATQWVADHQDAITALGLAAMGGEFLGPGGLAGQFGMSPGYAATALNAGALNTGLSLASGKNIGDSLKSGLTAAVLSPVSSFTNNSVVKALAGANLPAGVVSAIGTIAGNTALGGASAGVRGQNIGKGLQTGFQNGVINAVGNYAGQEAAGATNKTVGNIAGSAVKAGISGGNVGQAVTNGAIGAGLNYLGGNNETLGTGLKVASTINNVNNLQKSFSAPSSVPSFKPGASMPTPNLPKIPSAITAAIGKLPPKKG